MSAITKANNTNGAAALPSVWSDEQAIREQFGQALTQKEFSFFMGLGAMLGANPFTREIWAVKYGTNAAQIFLGRDFYRRKAQEQADYDGHIASAVYENDEFSMVNGQPHHKYRLTNRGHLTGAYCVVYKKNASVPYTVFVELREYNTGQSNWKTKPATMITKVAEAQALRGAFAGVFNGTYSEDEQDNATQAQKPRQDARKPISDILEPSANSEAVEDAVVVDETTGELFGDPPRMATPEQVAVIAEHAHLLSDRAQKKIIDAGDALTYEQADATLDALRKKGAPIDA